MTTEPDIPIGTRCMVDVAAMERDGPQPHVCGCPDTVQSVGWAKILRTLAEQVVVVSKKGRVMEGCCGAPHRVQPDEVPVDCYSLRPGSSGFLLRRKYLVPLPDGEDEREAT